jgi:hypothetical protein
LAIEDRVRKLEHKVALLVSIADCEKYPFICVCLDADVDVDQLDKILALITEVENSIGTANPISYAQFETKLQLIVPSKKGNSEFAKTIIRALNRENKFILPSKSFQEEGINL